MDSSQSHPNDPPRNEDVDSRLKHMRSQGLTPSRALGGSQPSGAWQAPTPEELQAQMPQYKVLEVLGRGGMGAVYQGWQVSLDRYVAIKILPQDLDDGDANFSARFKQEAKTMARLSHPGIIPVFDAGETATGLLYFVMEFVEGTDVSRMVKEQEKLSAAHALAITAHVCDALAYAHEHGVIHRDIKPANVMLNQEGQVKVADFGLAKSTELGANSGLTKSSMTMGTPDYVAPEALITGIATDHRVDLYAVGVMLYNMLTGEIPRGRWKLPSEKVGTDVRFDAIINKAMETEREDRYQSAREIRRDLDVILSTPMEKASSPPQAAPARKPVMQERGQSPGAPAAKPAASPSPPQRGAKVATSRKNAGAHRKNSSTVPILAVVGVLAALAVGAIFMHKPKTQGETSVAEDISASSGSASKSPPAMAGTPAARQSAVLFFAGHRYQLVSRTFSWLEAKSQAEMIDGHLATVTSKEEHDFLVENFSASLKDNLTGVWVGASTQSATLGWRWVTGEPFSYTAWGTTEPNGNQRDKKETFPYGLSLFRADDIYAGRYGWNDLSMNGYRWKGQIKGFIVEWDDQGKSGAATSDSATKNAAFVNTLGMKFVPVPITGGPTKGTQVLFSVWHTRVADYAAYAAADPNAEDKWTTVPSVDGVPMNRDPEHPVVGVSWTNAQAFCQWLTKKESAEGKLPQGFKYRLPSDEEWSWAVGLPPELGATPAEKSEKNSVDFPWGKDWPPTKKVGNYADETFHRKLPKEPADKTKDAPWMAGYDDGYVSTSPVGSFPANAFGLYDMGGNVWQWCEDWFDATHKDRVMRGASWRCESRSELLSSNRLKRGPWRGFTHYGFRCVLSAVSPTSSGVLPAVVGTPTEAAPLPSPAPSSIPAISATDRPIPKSDGKPADMTKPVQIFILLGQSNMVGMGKIPLLDAAVKEKKKYAYLVDDAGAWTERKDVRFVRYMSGKGPLK